MKSPYPLDSDSLDGLETLLAALSHVRNVRFISGVLVRSSTTWKVFLIGYRNKHPCSNEL